MWARVKEGKIVEGPMGELPYFWNDENGDPVELRALDKYKLKRLGWMECENRNFRPVDPRIETRVAPMSYVEDGLPVVEWMYAYRGDARDNMVKRIDEGAEEMRAQYITPGSGQAMIYLVKENEALRLKNDPDPNPEDYPLLASSLGVEADTLDQVADIVLYMAREWKRIAAGIESKRLSAKAMIQQASNLDDARRIMQQNFYDPSKADS